MMTQRLTIALCIALALGAASGCKHQSQAPSTASPGAPEAPAPAVSAKPADALPGAGEVIVSHESPKSWQLDPTPRQMREMTFNIGAGEKAADIIVSRLPEVTYTNDPLSNINRWRAQVALPPLTDLAAQKTETLTIGGAEGTLVDMAGLENRHLIVAMLRRNGIIWYFKLVGHHETVEAERKGLVTFLASLKFGEGKASPADDAHAGMNPPGTTLPSAHPPIGGGRPSGNPMLPEGHAPVGGGPAMEPEKRSALAEYKAPATWKQDPERRPMRELTFNIGEAAKNTVVIVSRLPAESYTVNPLANINRWRDQVGLGLIHNMADQPSRKITIGGEEGDIYDLSGPQGGRQILALITRGNDIWYFKIIGHNDVIDPEKGNFESFLASVKFGPGK